ncbi:MAG: MotA/TolQ/ExbB proton channel family protein [Gammaproteobacteria bacterium]|nr:MotA/TolQ/ExbB proton channel family protein [Gammaproteobacteria bacterium]
MRTLIISAMMSLLVVSGSAFAGQPASEPTTLDELLQQVRQASRSVAAENQRREREFNQALDRQQQLLEQARQELATEEARSDRLRSSFDANERELTQLSETLRTRMGNLGEVFGVVRQMAGNAKSMVDNSLVSAQIEDRGEVLSKLAQSRALPTISELEQLWFTFQTEMTESGKVIRFNDEVVGQDGVPMQSQVVRVGTFVTINQDGFLQFLPETGALVELGRQPAGRYVDMAEELYTAEGGDSPVMMAIDPTRGQLLGALIQAPTLAERIDQGGIIGYITLTLGLGGVIIALMRLGYLFGAGRKIKAQLGTGKASPDNALGRVLGVYAENRNDDIETLELKLDEAILKETPEFEKWQNGIKILAAVAPLMGLLGTVTGMIQTFQSITLFGTGDPKLMAGGISQALVTTVEGLVVAIPLVLLHSVVASRSKELIQILEEQSAGIIAAHAEKQQ